MFEAAVVVGTLLTTDASVIAPTVPLLKCACDKFNCDLSPLHLPQW